MEGQVLSGSSDSAHLCWAWEQESTAVNETSLYLEGRIQAKSLNLLKIAMKCLHHMLHYNNSPAAAAMEVPYSDLSSQEPTQADNNL